MRKAALALLPVIGFGVVACAGGPAAGSSSTPLPTTHTLQETHVKVTQLSGVAPPPTAVPLCMTQGMDAGPGSGGTNNGAFVVTTAVYNRGDRPCGIDGFPTVAITGLPPATGGWPRKQLTVTKVGTSAPFTLNPGDGAVVTLTFGVCQPGQEPFQAPVVLLGVGDKQLELTLEGGGDFTGCGDTVQSTPFEQHAP
ncbi:DUF4232 domain-containing protein [Kutzneria buriramensis]|uniref:Uncharacterized protein DUF4232 n=1 Tax=Kutzneria buriramensis TaxID=1045776 RepID=A0A3E0H757_9PSEU|nr:DUF4232 domain-containing protein [Kutzneria buriramensis]REH39273.1 uncharacterized protein DUF4232 [Kutzneria buriramensis]